MNSTPVPIALISGPVGVGKSTVGDELTEILESKGIAHTFIDFDYLRYTYPRANDDKWGNKLAFKNLKDIWSNCSQVGSLNLIISSVVEDYSFIEQLQKVVPECQVTTFQLSADVDTLQSRVRQREIGSGLDWHVKRAAELAEILDREDIPCDYRVQTNGRTVIEVARDIAELVSWSGG